MNAKTALDSLRDSDSILRLVDAAIEQRVGNGSAQDNEEDPSEDVQAEVSHTIGDANLTVRLQEISGSLAFGYQSILRILTTLRLGRGSIESVATDRLHPAHEKLQEVTNTTEIAATDILVGIEDSLAMVDRLDELDAAGDRDTAGGVRSDLRNKLFDLMNHLQFQDITRQQLSHASAVLLDTEQHLAQIAAAIEPTAAPLAVRSHKDPHAGTYDPKATNNNAAIRQAVADEVVQGKRVRG
jgi:chemotaxis regulatin CheY-phosphate phosphatase CheZ